MGVKVGASDALPPTGVVPALCCCASLLLCLTLVCGAASTTGQLGAPRDRARGAWLAWQWGSPPKQRGKRPGMDAEHSQPASSAPTSLDCKEVAERLTALSVTVRTTAALVYQDGRALQDVAELYGVTPDRIRQRLRQARKALGVSSAEEWRATVGAQGS